jgi:CubicO group peptidase (beta-lactamase class C family)
VLRGGAAEAVSINGDDSRPARRERFLHYRITKTMVAAAAMHLVGDERLRRDDPLAPWLRA